MTLSDFDTAYDRDVERESRNTAEQLSDRDARLLGETCWRCDAPKVGLADDGMGRLEPACAAHLTPKHDTCCGARCRHCPKANR